MNDGAAQGDCALGPGARISGRYRIEQSLGRGGHAHVFLAYDERAGARLALKCLLPPSQPRLRERMIAAFQHEFLVLTQVAHPNVVSVYDFGFEGQLPYYTMELLEGQPLSEAAPLPWDGVSALLRGLCEPLSILHSRRWVHRDLSPRNVIYTRDGRIKLIDFGATVSMDEHHPPMGTPPCTPPEVLEQQPLDARADVFGLGALAYFALTGRHAFQARTLTQLPALWARMPPRPSSFRADVPEAWDELLLAMLSVQPSGRPRSAAEVLHRLGSGSRASIPPNAQAARAYLETPKLVGRDEQLRQLRELLKFASTGRGRTAVVIGEHGMGRTRLLDALALEARVQGYAVVRASAKHERKLPLSLAKALGQAAQRVLEDGGAAAPAGDALSWLRDDGDLAHDDESALAAAQGALVEWLVAHSDHRPLLVLVDDFESSDAASQKLCAQLALRAKKRRVAVAVTSETDNPPPHSALRALLERGTPLRLDPLTEAEVESWARSLFGDVSNVARVARWLYQASAGKPADCMVFAEYLVDRGVATLSGGSWRLPDSVEALGVPSSVQDALHERLAGLGPSARKVLDLLATDVQPLPRSLAQYMDGFARRGGNAIEALAELTAARIVGAAAHGYALTRPAALEWARERIAPERRRALHEELAAWHRELGGDEDPESTVYGCYHLWRADRLADADALFGTGEIVRRSWLGKGARFNRTDQGIALFEALLAHRKQRGASPAALYPLRLTLLFLASTTRPDLAAYAGETMAALNHDVGFDLWHQFASEPSDIQRFAQCMRAAEQRHAAMAEAERGLAPMEALRALGTAMAVVSGLAAIRYEPELVWPLHETMARLRGLSPALDLIADIVEAAAKSLRFGADIRPIQRRVIEITRGTLANIDPSTLAGLNASYCYYLGMDLAADGMDEALDYAPRLEREPIYAVLGLQIRRTHALMTGDFRKAQRYRRERELMALQSEASNHTLHMSLLREMRAAFLCSDLLELNRCASVIRKRAQQLPGWAPWAACAQALAHEEAEESSQAHALIDAALAQMEPWSHGAWIFLLLQKAELLAAAADYAGACRFIEQLVQHPHDFVIAQDVDRRARAVSALAGVGLGDVEEGCARMQQLLEEAAVSPGRGSVMYGRLCEARCRIALMMRDEAAFTEHHAALAELYARHPGLRGRYERLRRAALRRFSDRDDDALASPEVGEQAWAERLSTAMATQSADEQPDYLLSLMLEEVESNVGQLYRVDDGGRPMLLASRPYPPDPKLLLHAQHYVATYRDLDELATCTAQAAPASTTDTAGLPYAPIGLLHPTIPGRLQGLLMLPLDAPRLAQLSDGLRRAVAQQLQML